MDAKENEKPGEKPHRIRFRKGDVIEIPPSAFTVEIEMDEYKGRKKLNVTKDAGAKVRKRLATSRKNS